MIMTKEKSEMTNEYNFKVGDKVTANQYYDIDINGYSTTIPIGEVGVVEDFYADEMLVSFSNYGVSLIRPISEFEPINKERNATFFTRLQSLMMEFDASFMFGLDNDGRPGIAINTGDKCIIARADKDENGDYEDLWITPDNINNFNIE